MNPDQTKQSITNLPDFTPEQITQIRQLISQKEILVSPGIAVTHGVIVITPDCGIFRKSTAEEDFLNYLNLKKRLFNTGLDNINNDEQKNMFRNIVKILLRDKSIKKGDRLRIARKFFEIHTTNNFFQYFRTSFETLYKRILEDGEKDYGENFPVVKETITKKRELVEALIGIFPDEAAALRETQPENGDPKLIPLAFKISMILIEMDLSPVFLYT